MTIRGADGDESTDGSGVWLDVVGATEGSASWLAIGCTVGTGVTATASHGTLTSPPATAAPSARTPVSTTAATSNRAARLRGEAPACLESCSNNRSAKAASG